jgi:antitoxin MazE
MTAMKVGIVRVGNSRGIRIPKPILVECGFHDTVELQIENHRLVIARARGPREGWEEAFRAAGSSAHDELFLDGPANQFDREEWRW